MEQCAGQHTLAKDDVSQRMLIEARTEGEQMVTQWSVFCKRMAIFCQLQSIAKPPNILKREEALTGGDKDAFTKPSTPLTNLRALLPNG